MIGNTNILYTNYYETISSNFLYTKEFSQYSFQFLLSFMYNK